MADRARSLTIDHCKLRFQSDHFPREMRGKGTVSVDSDDDGNRVLRFHFKGWDWQTINSAQLSSVNVDDAVVSGDGRGKGVVATWTGQAYPSDMSVQCALLIRTRDAARLLDALQAR